MAQVRCECPKCKYPVFIEPDLYPDIDDEQSSKCRELKLLECGMCDAIWIEAFTMIVSRQQLTVTQMSEPVYSSEVMGNGVLMQLVDDGDGGQKISTATFISDPEMASEVDQFAVEIMEKLRG